MRIRRHYVVGMQATVVMKRRRNGCGRKLRRIIAKYQRPEHSPKDMRKTSRNMREYRII